MNIGLLYTITALVSLLLIVSILNRTRATDYKETIDLPFCKMLRFFSVFCLTDSFWGLFSAKVFIVSQIGFTIISYGYHSLAALSAFIWLGYVVSYTKASPVEKTILNVLRTILFITQMTALISNFWTHNAFWVDAMGNYSTGGLRIYLYAMQFSYYLITMIYSIYKRFKDPGNCAIYQNAILFSLIPFFFGIGQYVFYDAAMYSLGFMVCAFMIYLFNVTAQREHFMAEQLYSLDRRQSSIIQGLAGNFVSIYYVDLLTDHFDIYRKPSEGLGFLKKESAQSDYFNMVLERAKGMIVPEDMDLFLHSFNKETLLQELKEKNTYTLNIRVFLEGEPTYFQYRFVRPASEVEGDKLIVGVYNVDTEVRAELARQEQIRLAAERETLLKDQANRLSVDVYIDVLTGLYNRRAYEDDILHYPDIPPEADFVYISLDLNGLKIVNDTLGHDAGDELIKAAAFCMRTCFGSYGKLYRVGGDEFVAMIFADKQKLTEITADFEETMMNWKGNLVEDLSISYGCVMKSEAPNLLVTEIAKLADRRMYQYKENYYTDQGIDRRGQQEAYRAICDSYTKILRANLTTDSYSIIQMDSLERCESKGFDIHISTWLHNFATSGQVHEDDRSYFIAHTDIEYLRNYFQQGHDVFCLYYRRMIDGSFKHAMMEILPSIECTSDNQIVFLYVKNIER